MVPALMQPRSALRVPNRGNVCGTGEQESRRTSTAGLDR